MKKYLLLITAFLGLPVLVSAQNDVYFIPSKQVKEVKVKKQNVDNYSETTYSALAGDEDYQLGENYSANRSVDEYNRRSTPSSEVYQAPEDTILKSQVEEGYDDYSCSKMILRFHTPRGVIISSPYYWDICYGNTWDVYYDAWAWGLPSWGYWSYAYDPWYYNRWWYRTCWDYTWGWYDPWWGAGYWGWHSPCYWGWHRPFVYGGIGYAHHWYYGGSYGPVRYEHGFNHSLAGGGRRSMASGNASVHRGSAGGFIRQNSGVINRGNANGSSRSFANNQSSLSKSFRTTNPNNQYATTGRSSGGGFSRNNGTVTNRQMNTNTYNRRNVTTQSNSQTNNNQRMRTYSNQNTQTYQNRQTNSNSSYQPSQSYSRSSSSSSSSRSSGGSVSSGGSRSGGGGFSRGGGGGRR